MAEPAQPDQRGRRGPVVLGGLAAFGGLFVLTAMFGTRSIERDLTRDTRRALSAALPATSYGVSFDGRDARLVADSVDDLSSIDAARRVVLDIHGVRAVEVDERAPTAQASIRATAERDGDGVTLTGTVLSDAERQALVAAAQAAVGTAAVDDQLRVEAQGRATAATDGALGRLADVVVAFGGVTSAHARLEGTVLTVSGRASTAAGADAVNAAVRAAADAGLVTQGTVTGPGATSSSSGSGSGSGSGSNSTTGGSGGAGGTGAAGRTVGGATSAVVGATTAAPAVGGPAAGGPAGSIATVIDTGAPRSAAAVGGVVVRADRDLRAITLSGRVLSDAQRGALVTAAGQAVGPRAVVDQLTVAGAAPTATDDARVIRLAAVVATFGSLVDGQATLTDARLTVTGTAVDTAGADAVNASVEAAQGAGLSVSSSITPTAGDAAATAPPGPPTAPATAGPFVTIPTSTVSAASAVPGAGPGDAETLAATPFRSTASSATAIGS